MTVEAPTETKTSQRLECPACGEKAKRVSAATLGALLKDEFAKQFATTIHSCCNTSGQGCKPIDRNTGWRFCAAIDCDLVYFAEEGDATFTKSQLKVPVGLKETSGERPLCYCFGHSVATIKAELRAQGSSNALDDIRTKMKDPGCRCETKNPAGSCCLGSVARGIEIAQQELASNGSNVPHESTSPPTI